MVKRTIKELREEVRKLEKGRELTDERKKLEKRIKAMKFAKTRFGKVGLAVTRVGAKLTQPAQRTKEGKVIAGTGGLGAKVIAKLKETKPAQPRVPRSQLSPMERTFADPSDAPMPIPMKKKKPFSIDKFIKNLPA